MTRRILTAIFCANVCGHALAQDLTLPTTFAGGGAANGVMFDVTGLDASGVYLKWFSIGCPAPVSQSWVDVWTRSGSYVGHENSADGWVYSATGYFQCGTGPLGGVFTLNQRPLGAGQTIGVFIESWGVAGMSFTPTPPAAAQYSDAHVRISGGIAKIGPGFSGASVPASIWNGQLQYRAGAPGCFANCDESTTSPILTASDFQCFLNLYNSIPSYGNCDRSTSQPLLNANDFQCFLNAYAAGCTAP